MGRGTFPPRQTDYSGRGADGLEGDKPATLDTELHPGWSWAQPEHIPTPTYWPAALALGITLLLWGLITSPLLVGIGLIVFVLALAGWIGEMRNENRQQ
jgi:hypothetical protein